jgi:hypothetical protein
MLRSATQAHVEAIRSLRGAPAWKTLCNLLTEELTALQDRMVREVDDTAIRWLQGRAQTVTELLELFTSDREQRPTSGPLTARRSADVF